MSIRSGLEKVLKEYLNARENEVFAENPLANFIRHDLKESVEAACENPDKYLVKGSAGQGVWARGPWIGVFNPIITSSAQAGYYVCYLFREDMQGVYLSLNQAMTEAKNLYKSDAITALKARAENFRAILGPNTGDIKVKAIDLAPSSKSNDTAFYEAGNIIAKYYSRDAMPTENILIDDLWSILNLYDDLISGGAASEVETQLEGDEPENILFEDATKLRLHKRIERNSKLAKEAKRIHGYSCQVCGLNFEEKYGEIGKGYIEAHHLEPISELKSKKIARNPEKDFAVLCANCHRMIHRSKFVGELIKFTQLHYLKDK